MNKKAFLKKQPGGDHYKSLAIQPIELIEKINLSYSQGNIVKYLSRKKEDKKLDLQKALHYLIFCEKYKRKIKLLTKEEQSFADKYSKQLQEEEKEILNTFLKNNLSKTKKLLENYIKNQYTRKNNLSF